MSTKERLLKYVMVAAHYTMANWKPMLISGSISAFLVYVF